ncbi:PWWP domain-containing protein 2A isoform X2 [Betta splendens]|uniref:PWWP domain-containing protein 2A isoform X2 n=1 Tax=Betta splendens TaxID=158456 RepID=A0A8M1HMF4_BETSP|nr:PWWP domain-containing protein 2A isoform X2 [Betta splendens]
MAAVAAEAGAAAVPTTATTAATDDGRPAADSGLSVAPLETDESPESVSESELFGARVENSGNGEGRRHVRPELDSDAGKALCETTVNDELTGNFSLDRASMERFSPGLPVDPENGGNMYCSILPDPQPSAVFLHSFPAPPPATEAGLSLFEPAEPTTNVTTDRSETAGRDLYGYTALPQPKLRPVTVDGAMLEDTADRLSDSVSLDSADPDTGNAKNTAETEELAGRCLQDSIPPCRSPKRRPMAEKIAAEDSARPDPAPEPGLGPLPLTSFHDLSPGSEVRVSLDHVIDDALVVSFRVGEKIFSGVLMDVSKRFGPYGIPITVFPKRHDQTPPQLSLQREITNNLLTKQEEEESVIPAVSCHSWTSKPPPLFQEGAPYPPPLFIRDTYNQTLPQPPPRKIKRPKRRYRSEEPTSIMNAIKLRPRQVLCDKCKGVVSSGGHREVRRGPLDLRSEEVSRRRRPAEGPMSLELKRLKSDNKGGRAERRSTSGIRVTSSSTSSSSRLRSTTPSSSSSAPLRLKLNSKKVLAKGSADRSKARQVLKNLTRSSQPPHPRPKDQSQIQTRNPDHPKAMTRAAALQNHNQKVHFTRRLQHLSGAASTHSALPPRMRLKPQRYRTDEAPCPPTKHSPHLSPPKPAVSPSPTEEQVPTQIPPSLCVVSVAVEMQDVCPPEERVAHQLGGVGKDQVMEPPCPSSSTNCSPPSECSSTEMFDVPPSGDLPSSLSSSAPPSSSSPVCPPPQDEEEEEEEGSDLKKRLPP